MPPHLVTDSSHFQYFIEKFRNAIHSFLILEFVPNVTKSIIISQKANNYHCALIPYQKNKIERREDEK
jgi:hypothetical protein